MNDMGGERCRERRERYRWIKRGERDTDGLREEREMQREEREIQID